MGEVIANRLSTPRLERIINKVTEHQNRERAKEVAVSSLMMAVKEREWGKKEGQFELVEAVGAGGEWV